MIYRGNNKGYMKLCFHIMVLYSAWIFVSFLFIWCWVSQLSLGIFDIFFHIFLWSCIKVCSFLFQLENSQAEYEEKSSPSGIRALRSNRDIHCFSSSGIKPVFKIQCHEQADGFWHCAARRPSSNEIERRHLCGCFLQSCKSSRLDTTWNIKLQGGVFFWKLTSRWVGYIDHIYQQMLNRKS